MGVRESVNSDLQRQLGEAAALLESGDVESARGLASVVLKVAEEQEDRLRQAQALMVLAQYDRAVGRLRRAVEAAQRAVHLFQLEGDIASEANALSLLAHANIYLGHDEEAVEAGLLSVRLGDLLPAGPLQVNLYNYLGVAYLWAKSFGSAESALRESERLALQLGAPGHALLPRINLAWLECVRQFMERYFTGARPRSEILRTRLEQCSALYEDQAPFPGLPGVKAILQRFGRCAWALLLCWEGDLSAAQHHLEQALDPMRPGNYAQVANFIVHWVRAEICWAGLDHEAAQAEVALLIEQSGSAEFEQMAYLGHLLLTQIHFERGQHGQARDEERAHRRRELRVRANRLDSRHRIVDGQLEIRSSKRHLQMLTKHSKELERLSYEDSLTGIANRRRFEQQLSALLNERLNPQLPLCVALIDLDDFKRVNDTHSHAAGDEVLKSVANAMKTVLRESDLLARLGGDEFVVLFPNTDALTAVQVCERIKEQLNQLNWPQLSPRLKVSASVGVAQARPGEAVADLLHRSDAEMFRSKAGE